MPCDSNDEGSSNLIPQHYQFSYTIGAENFATWMKHTINTAFTTIRVVKEAKKDFSVTPLA